MEIVKPKLEEKLNPDIASEIAKYGGKNKIYKGIHKMKTRRVKQSRRAKKRMTRKRGGATCRSDICPRAPNSDKRRRHVIGPDYPPQCVQCGCTLY